jgi:hypothetical protein
MPNNPPIIPSPACPSNRIGGDETLTGGMYPILEGGIPSDREMTFSDKWRNYVNGCLKWKDVTRTGLTGIPWNPKRKIPMIRKREKSYKSHKPYPSITR